MKTMTLLSALLISASASANTTIYSCDLLSSDGYVQYEIELSNGPKASFTFLEDGEAESEASECDIMPTGLLDKITLLCTNVEGDYKTVMNLNIARDDNVEAPKSHMNLTMTQGQNVVLEQEEALYCKKK